jgi:glycosyltransferase involved in cell wall biosynthesis
MYLRERNVGRPRGANSGTTFHMGRIRLAYLVSHPIQYQASLLRAIAADPDFDLKVFFCSDLSVRAHVDPGFGRPIAWDVPLLDGYTHEFLPAFGARDRLSFWRPFSYGLAERLKRGRFEVLWVHGYARWTNWMAMASAKRLGIKVLVRDEPWLDSAVRGAPKRLLKHVFFWLLRQICDGFLVIGSLNRTYYLSEGIPEGRTFLVPYAVDNAHFQAHALQASRERESLRASLGLEPAHPVILYASKFEARKRPDDLLEAYLKIARDPALRQPCLIYIGDGALRPVIEARVRASGLDSIRLLGFKNQTELPAYFDLCDVFVLPSLREPWGLVVNEAMNAGRAIIVSDQVGAGADLVREGENGAIFRAGDVDDLARALRGVLADPVRCAAMGRCSVEMIERWSFAEDLAGLKRAVAYVTSVRDAAAASSSSGENTRSSV